MERNFNFASSLFKSHGEEFKSKRISNSYVLITVLTYTFLLFVQTATNINSSTRFYVNITLLLQYHVIYV